MSLRNARCNDKDGWSVFNSKGQLGIIAFVPCT